MFNQLKKSAISSSIKKVITAYLKRKNLGELKVFKLNSKKRKIELSLLLRKENHPIEIVINNYNFIKEKEKGYLTFDSIKTSRDWNSKTLENIIGSEDKKIKIPDKYVKIVEIFL